MPIEPVFESVPFVRDRFSPLRFDAEHELSTAALNVILDAGRRAPSAGNSQPWAFIVGRRGDAVHQRLIQHLARSSSMWAPDASVLIANLAQVLVEDSDFEYSEFAKYDLAQAVSHMIFQAHAFGLQVHQFRAFDRAAVEQEFEVPRHWEVVTMSAIGVPHLQVGDLAGAGTSRERRTIREITWSRVDGTPE